MKPTFLIPGLILGALALPLLAVPSMAQNHYGYRYLDREVPVSGARMTDWPSGRFNVTESGSFLRPGRHFYQDRVEFRGHYRRQTRGYYDRRDDDKGW
jgi:hypothetical protein